MRQRWIIALLLLLVAAAPSAAAGPPEVQQVLHDLAERLHMEIVVQPAVHGLVRSDLSKLAPAAAFHVALRDVGAASRRVDGIVLVGPPGRLASWPTSLPGFPRSFRKRITLDFVHADLVYVLKIAAQETGSGLLLDNLRGDATCLLRRRPVGQILALLLGANGTSASLQRGVLVAGPHPHLMLPARRPSRRIALDLVDASATYVLRTLARSMRVNLLCTDSVKGRVTVTFQGPASDLMALLTAYRGDAVRQVGNVAVVGTPAELSGLGTPPRQGPSVSLDLVRADLVTVLWKLAAEQGRQLAVDPAVTGSVTARWSGVPADGALYLLARRAGFTPVFEAGRVTVTARGGNARPQPGPLQAGGRLDGTSTLVGLWHTSRGPQAWMAVAGGGVVELSSGDAVGGWTVRRINAVARKVVLQDGSGRTRVYSLPVESPYGLGP